MRRILAAVLAVALSLFVPSQVASAAGTVKIIPIGDSVTADFGQGSYRLPLGSMLSNAGVAYSYVGANVDVGGRHEAYGGTSSCDFVVPRTRDYIETTYGKSPTWTIRQGILDAGGQIAIVDIGTNDWIDWLYDSNGVPGAPCILAAAHLNAMYEMIWGTPGITGMVVTTIESASGPNLTDNANTIIKAWVTQAQAQGRNVCLAELPTNFAGLTNVLPDGTVDPYHLNPNGRTALANSIFPQVQKAIAGTCAPPPSSTLTPLCSGFCVPFPSDPMPALPVVAVVGVVFAWSRRRTPLRL